MTLGPTLSVLSQRIRKELETSPPIGIVLDVSQVTTVDSAGLGELTMVYTLAARRNCAVVLAGVNKSLQHSLDMTRLDQLLSAAPDVAAAKKAITGRTAS